MKTTILVPLALLTCSAAIPTRKGERKWRRGIEHYRQHEKVEHAKHLRRRIQWIGALGVLAKGGENYDDDEEAYDPAAYGMEAASYEDERRLAVDAGMSGYCPLEDVVTCVDGFASSVGNVTYDEGTKTCQVACGGECCVGVNEADSSINSCTGFNGKVCKSGDIPSCSDNRTSGVRLGKACYNANITEVINGCNGLSACEYAGYKGDVGRVVNACYGGDYSCYYAAYDGGYIKEIVDSCIGKQACRNTASNGGNISSITNGSCDGDDSCFLAGQEGFIGYINHGCRGYKACFSAAFDNSIGGISYACNNNDACSRLAQIKPRGSYASVNSAVVSCCNEVYECRGSIVDAKPGLPDQCGTSSPTSSPTTEPTGSPITASPSSPPTQMPTTASPSSPPTQMPTTASPSSSPTHMPSQQPTPVPTASPSKPPTDNPSSSPTSSPTTPAKIKKINAATFVRKNVRRRLDKFDEASDECVLVVENVTAWLVHACFTPEERVLNVATLNVTSLDNDALLRFDQELEIGGGSSSSASRLNDLQACVDKSVTDGNATNTLQANAAIVCFEYEDSVIERLVLAGADATTEAPTSAAPNGTPVSLAPSGPSVQTKSPFNSDTDAPTLAPGSSTKSSKASGKTSKTNSSSTKSAKSDIKSKASSKSSKKSIKVEGEESEETTSVINETAKVEKEEPTEAIEETTMDKEEEKSFMGVILEVVGNVLGGWGR